MQRAVDQVNIKPGMKKSVAYAMCRAAFNTDAATIYKDNVAGAKNFKASGKAKAIAFLDGKVEWKDGKKFVMFKDGSQARY